MKEDISHHPLRKQISNKARMIRAKLALIYAASEINEKESIEPREMYSCQFTRPQHGCHIQFSLFTWKSKSIYGRTRSVKTWMRMETFPCLFVGPPLTSNGHDVRTIFSSSFCSSSRTTIFSNSEE